MHGWSPARPSKRLFLLWVFLVVSWERVSTNASLASIQGRRLPSQLLLFSSFPRGELCSVGKGEGRRGLHCTTPSGIFHILPPMMRPSTRRAETKDQDEDEGIVRNSSFGSPAKEGEEAKRRLLTRTLEKEKKKRDRRRRRRSTTEGQRGEGESHRSSLLSQLEEEEGTIYSPGRKH